MSNNNEGEKKPKPRLNATTASFQGASSQPFIPDSAAPIPKPAAPLTGAPERKPLKMSAQAKDFAPISGPKLQPTSTAFTPPAPVPSMPMPVTQMMYSGMPGMPGMMGFPTPFIPQMMPTMMAPNIYLPQMNPYAPMGIPMMPQPYNPALGVPTGPVTSSVVKDMAQAALKPPRNELKTTTSAPFQPDPKPEPVEVKPVPVPVPAPVVPEPVKQPEPVKDEDDDDDDDNVAVVADTEDYSKYPQEKPAKMIYNREWIKEFLAKEKAISDPKFDEAFEDLDRDIQSLPKGSGGGRPGGSGGYNNFGSRPGGKSSYGNSRPNDRDRGGRYGDRDDRGPYGRKPDRQRDEYKPANSSMATGLTGRQETTEESRKRIQELQNDSSSLVNKANQDDEEKRTHKTINFTLNQLAAENFNDCLQTLSEYLVKSPQLCEKIVGMLIDKAWTQTTYTELFSKLLAKLGECKMEWMTGISPERLAEIKRQYREEDPVKIFKNIIVTKVRKEFNEGFERLQNIMHSAEDNKEYNDERKTIEYNKSRDKFLANMSFIAQLYKLKYLPHKVMRTIAFQICDKFMLDFCNREFAHYSYKTCDVFLMAFFRLMTVAGTTMEKKEAAEKEKEVTQPRDKWEENQRKKSKAFVDVMIKCVNEGVYNQSEVISRFGDADKKEVNFIHVVFAFVDSLVKTGKISLLLKAHCVTALEERKVGWKPSAAPAAPAPVAEKPKQKEVSEYVVKQPSAPAKATIDVEMEEIFKRYRTQTDLEEYKIAFGADEEQFKGVTGVDILTSFLKFFLKHGSNKDIYFLRAQLTSTIVTNFRLEESVFWTRVGAALAKWCNEDVPARAKALGLVINDAIINLKFDIKNLEPVFDSDPDEKENQAYFYQDVIDASVAALTEAGNQADAIEKLKAFKTAKLKV